MNMHIELKYNKDVIDVSFKFNKIAEMYKILEKEYIMQKDCIIDYEYKFSNLKTK